MSYDARYPELRVRNMLCRQLSPWTWKKGNRVIASIHLLETHQILRVLEAANFFPDDAILF